MQPSYRGMPCPSFARQSATLCKQSNYAGSRPEIGRAPAPARQASRMAYAARTKNIENNPMHSSGMIDTSREYLLTRRANHLQYCIIAQSWARSER
jgi:hypothetical protein